jgi:squalene synthase HpnD
MTPLGADKADLAATEAIVRRAGTSFYRGMRILPPDRRYAMYGVYAFCRLVDDIADEAAPIDDKRRQLDDWRTRIDVLAHGQADDPVTRVLLAATRAFGLRGADFIAVIDGMQMDAETVIVAPDLATLDLYCDRVAAAVGRLSVRCFGDGRPQADRVAFCLGRALQLTNILRDVYEDAERGRLYLPAEFLDEEGIEHDPDAALRSPRLPRVCERVALIAHEYFDHADEAMLLCDQAAMKPARLMSATYAALLARIEQRGWIDLAQPVSLSKLHKLSIAARHGLLR